MQLALEQARGAAQVDEVPVGAVLIKDGSVIARGFNQMRSSCDPTAHAEIQVIRAAAEALGTSRLTDTTLYVTLEPCLMCVGAMVHARIERLVFGAREPKSGAVISAFEALMSDHHNHRVAITEGVLSDQCSMVLSEFFTAKR